MGPRIREDNGEGDGGEGGFQTRPYEIDSNVGVNCTSRAYSRSSGIQGG